MPEQMTLSYAGLGPPSYVGARDLNCAESASEAARSRTYLAKRKFIISVVTSITLL
jgi:hypothetical protein